MKDSKIQNRNVGQNPSQILHAYEKYGCALKNFISRYLNNKQDIEDIAQEAFLRAYSAEMNTEIQQPKSFLFRIAKNVAISELRLKSRQLTDYLEENTPYDVLSNNSSSEDEVIAQQKLGIHCEAVATLPPRCRLVYIMRKVDGMSHKEIAKKLEISVSTVEKHLIKGVEICDRFIRERLKDEENYPGSPRSIISKGAER